jgi:hypothetical protein
MNAKSIGKWLFLLGLLIAVIASLFSYTATWLSLILVVLGIATAILFFDTKDLVHMGIRFLVLAAVAGALNSVPAVGMYITGIFTAAVAFLAPVLLTLLVLFFFKKYFMGEQEE